LTSYGRYVETFDKERAANPRLSYVITSTIGGMDLKNLERWYQRDTGERVGKFTLFRLQLRDDGGADVSKSSSTDNKTPAIAKGL
jgi:hypothetical protein